MHYSELRSGGRRKESDMKAANQNNPPQFGTFTQLMIGVGIAFLAYAALFAGWLT